MEDILLDEDFKSDKYEISINELLFGRVYKSTTQAVAKLLDDNGYYGRYKIEHVKDRKHGIDTMIKIHVYLVDSGHTYTWPFQTYFNLDKRCFAHNRKVPRGVLSDSFMFGYCLRVLSVMFTPESRIEVELDKAHHYTILCMKCMRIINENNSALEDWPWIICKNHGSFGQMPYYKKIIPFLVRIGLIVNRKFIITSSDDANEICDNLFDINYWYNI